MLWGGAVAGSGARRCHGRGGADGFRPMCHACSLLRTSPRGSDDALSTSNTNKQQTRCLCENNWSAALNRARELDSHWRNFGSTIGPLHGLTVSLMDRYHVAGLDAACGFVSWLNVQHTAKDEGTLVRTLRHLGAVVHCKTNVPMSLMLGETANNIIGTTVNPYNVSLSAGGACGGEGALLSLRGSSIGFGTETAGSSRIPAAFCGLWALKCSENRLPQDGIATVLPGLAEGAIGMLANDHETLAFVLKTMLNSTLTTSNPDHLPLHWRQELLDAILRRKNTPGTPNGRLVFGILPDDNHVRPHPPIRRALDLLADALRQRGHEVVQWRPPPHIQAVETLFKILGSTSASEARAALKASGEPPIPQLEDWYQHQDIAPSDSAEFWALCAERQRYRTEYRAYWNGMGPETESGRVPDAVIMPAAATLAVRPGQFKYYGYSAIVNALDYVAGVFPVTTADRNIDVSAEELEPLSDLDKEVQSSCKSHLPYHLLKFEADLVVPNVDSSEDAHGLPVALQVMVPRLGEEVATGLMEVINECLADI